jgi:V/A-type H+-transporting ATPase subunit I
MLLSMRRVQIIGTKRCQGATVKLLHRLGVIQIDAWNESRALSQKRMALGDKAIHLRERLAYTATRVEAVLTVLPDIKSPPTPEYEHYYIRPPDELLCTVDADLAEIESLARELTKGHDQLEQQLASLARYEATLRQLLPVVPAFIDLERYTVTAIWLERRYQAVLDVITRQLEELTEGLCEVVFREVSQDIMAAVLIFPRNQAKRVDDLLSRENISQVHLPPDLANQPFEQALIIIRQRLQAIPDELTEIEMQQKSLAQAWRARLLLWQALLHDNLAQIDVCTDFGQTDYTFIIEGWVPEPRLIEMQTVLAREIGDEVLVVELPLRAEEEKSAPVVFDNLRLVRPFEPLVGLLALPRYGGFDPTPLMALFFPLFFGMILGDVAYGLILLGLMLYLRQRFKSRSILRSLTEALTMGAVWSIVFGFLYGEFFGTLGELVGLHALWFDRGRNVQALFLLTIGLGAGHIVLGLSLGIWDGLRRHKRYEVTEKAAMLVALMALFLLVGVLAEYLPDTFFTPGVAMLVVGLAILIYSLGKLGLLLGPLELLSTVGNILSYLRIAAIGLSSVYLAQVANELAGIAGNFLVGFIIATLFHTLNLILGSFSPTIQSLRLHYVEFFSKFYQGGGQPFRPFQRSIIYR